MSSPQKHQVIRIDYSDSPSQQQPSKSIQNNNNSNNNTALPLTAPSQELRRQRRLQFWRRVMIFGMLLILLAGILGILYLVYRKRK